MTAGRAAALLPALLLALGAPARAEPYAGLTNADRLLGSGIAWLLVLGMVLPVALALTVATGARQPSQPRFWITAAALALALALVAGLLHIPAMLQEVVLMLLRLLF